MPTDNSVIDIAKVFGIGNKTALILRIVTTNAPINQAGLRREYNKIMEDKGSISKQGVSKACKTLVYKRKLIEELESGRSKMYTLNERTLEWLRRRSKSLEFAYIEHIIDNIQADLKHDSSIFEEDFLQKENELYDLGKWGEARQLLWKYRKKDLLPLQESERQRLLGWCCYYLGKKGIENKEKIGNEARKAFIKVLQLGEIPKDVDSALNGLPLVYYYLLKEPEKAIRISEKSVEKAKNRGQTLNTQGILKKEEGFIVDAVRVFSESYKTAKDFMDYRTSGHALNNKARTLMMLLPEMKYKGDLLKEIKYLFNDALKEYKNYERETDGSAKFHIADVYRKIDEVETLCNNLS